MTSTTNGWKCYLKVAETNFPGPNTSRKTLNISKHVLKNVKICKNDGLGWSRLQYICSILFPSAPLQCLYWAWHFCSTSILEPTMMIQLSCHMVTLVGCRMLQGHWGFLQMWSQEKPWLIMGFNTQLWSGEFGDTPILGNLWTPPFCGVTPPSLWSPSSFWGVNGVNLSQVTIRFRWDREISRAALLQDARCAEETHGDTDAHHQVPIGRPTPDGFRASWGPHGQGISRAICVGKHWGQVRNGSFPNQIGPV